MHGNKLTGLKIISDKLRSLNADKKSKKISVQDGMKTKIDNGPRCMHRFMPPFQLNLPINVGKK